MSEQDKKEPVKIEATVPTGMTSARFIAKLGSGTAADELFGSFVKVADEVRATGNPGTVTLTLKVAIINQAQGLVGIEETIGVKLPMTKPLGALVYVDNGQAYTQDPNQATMNGIEAFDGGVAVKTFDDLDTATVKAGQQ